MLIAQWRGDERWHIVRDLGHHVHTICGQIWDIKHVENYQTLNNIDEFEIYSCAHCRLKMEGWIREAS